MRNGVIVGKGAGAVFVVTEDAKSNAVGSRMATAIWKGRESRAMQG